MSFEIRSVMYSSCPSLETSCDSVNITSVSILVPKYQLGQIPLILPCFLSETILQNSFSIFIVPSETVSARFCTAISRFWTYKSLIYTKVGFWLRVNCLCFQHSQFWWLERLDAIIWLRFQMILINQIQTCPNVYQRGCQMQYCLLKVVSSSYLMCLPC